MVANLTVSQIVLGLAVAIWIVVSLYFIGLFIIRKRLLRDFKGPFAIPFLGNCYNSEPLSFMRFLAELRKRYGKIFAVYPFAKAYLVICDPAVVRRVLSDTKTFIKGADYKDVFSVGFGQGLVTSSGEKHRHDRAIFGKYFIKSNVAKYTGVMNQVIKDVMEDKFAKPFKKSGAHSMPINIEDFFAITALRVFMTFCLNANFKDDPELEEEVCKKVSEGSGACAKMMLLNLPMWSIFTPVQKIISARKCVLKACSGIVADRKALMDKNEAGDLDDCLTAMLRENLSEKDLLDHVMTLVCAGHDTTAFFSSFMCLLLAQNPDAQDKLRDEINRVLGDRDEVTIEHVSELKYMQKVMQETLRLYAVIPTVSREATEDVVLKEAGITIPKGAVMLIPFFLMNRDPTLWENPSKFDPERFDASTVEFTSAKNGFFPFGYGSRTCIGNTLAQAEACVFMCHILRQYRFEALPGFKPTLYGGISLTTSNGVHVVVKPL